MHITIGLKPFKARFFGEAHGTYVGPGESEVPKGASLVPAPSAAPALEPPAAVHHCSCWGFHQLPSGLVTELSPWIGMIALYRKIAPSPATLARARHPFPVVALRLNLSRIQHLTLEPAFLARSWSSFLAVMQIWGASPQPNKIVLVLT